MIQTYIILLVILAIVGIASFLVKNEKSKLAPIIILAAIVGSLVAGMGLSIREVVEGPFAYFDTILAVLTGVMFISVLMENGSLNLMLDKIITKKHNPFMKALLLILLVALPGIVTGSALACVLTTGILVGSYLLKKGIDKIKVVEFVAVGSLLGMILPPISIPSMIMVISQYGSYPAAFEGYTVPLLLISLPALLAYASVSSKWIGALEVEEGNEAKKSNTCFISILVVGILIFAHNFLFTLVPFLGYPLIFVIGTILAILLPVNKFNIIQSLGKGINIIAPVVAIVFAIGSTAEIFALTGITGRLATVFYTINPILFTIASFILVVIMGLFIGGPFAALIGIMSSYVLGAIVYGGNQLLVLSVGIALSIGIFTSLRGGIIASTSKAIGVDSVDSKSVILGAKVPLIIIIIIGLTYALLYKNLLFLIV